MGLPWRVGVLPCLVAPGAILLFPVLGLMSTLVTFLLIWGCRQRSLQQSLLSALTLLWVTTGCRGLAWPVGPR